MKRITIAVADDHSFVRQGMVHILNESEGLEVLFDVSNGKELLNGLKKTIPDIVLLDIEMPLMGGKETLLKIRELYPEVKVIMISSHYHESYITEFLVCGAKAFLPKNYDSEKVVDAIYAVYDQGCYFDTNVSKSLITRLMKTETINPSTNRATLSEREIDVLKLFCREKNAEEVANQLSLSKRTIEWHKENIFSKTKAKNDIGLVIYALKHKIITETDLFI